MTTGQKYLEQDEQARVAAIDPAHSFIVQAPAGSGKTELLTQRFLNLLAHAVTEPEEIISITFTRKAASEMRERIVTALLTAKDFPEPPEPHKKITWTLANKVLQADHKYNWQLLKNPNRLRIQTIDALSAMLNAQIPLLSGFGAKPKIANDSSQFYTNAVNELFALATDLKPELSRLLLHLDNKAAVLSNLLVGLLRRREQWLPTLLPHTQKIDELKIKLEQSLKNLVIEKIERADAVIPNSFRYQIAELADFAGNELKQISPDNNLVHCIGLNDLPQVNINNLNSWRGIAELFFTKELTWRKSIDKRHGFPTTNKAMKQQMLELLDTLADNEEVQQSLAEIALAPPIEYTASQWEIIVALIKVLPTLTALLHLQFRAAGTVDFVELTLGALRALGENEAPTDLACYLDYQIKHILVDEFQDTSVMQLNLFNRLIQEWQPDEGKTLFLVGDPMQSIYRFRNAEVSLFLRAQQYGLGNIALKSLTLHRNFRSDEVVVNWLNTNFSAIFPKIENLVYGAVAYSPAAATQQSGDNSGIHYYATDVSDQSSQAEAVVKLIQTIDPTESIVILVRSRRHLLQIIPELNAAKINYQAVELETLDQRQEIIDLMSLTRALLHPADRIAWLAVLRAPWCGLKLADLHAVCHAANEKPLWPTLINYATIENLSDDAKKRLEFVVPILAHSKQTQGRMPLGSWIKGTWLALQGHLCLQDSSSRNNILSFFALLEEIETDFSLLLLETKLATLYARPLEQTTTNLHLMTIHKSKGLEFDHVILPELQSSPPMESNPLLMWLERQNVAGETDLILAPIKASAHDFDPIHRHLKRIESNKLALEYARLLYVAVTRAKKSLHLLTKLSLDINTGEIKSPAKNSFLELLWPQLQTDFLAVYEMKENIINKTENQRELIRLCNIEKSSLTLPSENSLTTDKNHPTIITKQQQFSSILGTLIHGVLATNATSEAFWRRRLTQIGILPENHDFFIKKIVSTIQLMQADKIGCWILAEHQNAKNEYAISSWQNGKLIQQIIDRTFIDEAGTRWIIDYKTTTPEENLNFENFLNQQKLLHQQQLLQYAQSFSLMEERPIRLGLYFPLCQGWVCWDYDLLSTHNKLIA